MPVINKRKKKVTVPDRIFMGALFDFLGFITASSTTFKNNDRVGWLNQLIGWGKLPNKDLAYAILAMRLSNFVSFTVKEKEFSIGSNKDVTPLIDTLKKYGKKYNIDTGDADVKHWEDNI